METTLYSTLRLKELRLIIGLGLKYSQHDRNNNPIIYPVMDQEYAEQAI